MGQSKLSVQLYSVREAIAADLPGALRRVAEIGFRQVELYGFVDRPEEYRDALDAAGLSAPSGHAALFGQDAVVVLASASTIGVETVIDPHIDDSLWRTRDDLAAIATQLNDAARIAADSGIRIGYHNHAFEFENQVDGVSALEVLADLLDPSVVLELDTYWAAVGGETDVPALLRRLGDRVQFLHVKDGPLTKDDKQQVAVGAGSMPVDEILAAAPHALQVVELDDFDGDIFDALTDSYRFLTERASQ